MRSITRRLSSLVHLARPLALTFVGVVLLSLGVAYLFIHLYRTVEGLPGIVYLLTLQFLPRPARGLLLLAAGLGALGAGIWQLSGVVVIPRGEARGPDGELVLGYGRAGRPPRVVVLSGGAGMLVLGSLSDHVARMTCIVPAQDPVEYYYRASSLLNLHNVYYVVPTPTPLQVIAELDDRTSLDVRHIDLHPELAGRHIARLGLEPADAAPAQLRITRLAADAIREADAIVLGPGSLFESVLPNFLLDEFREAVAASKARKIYICNLMTEPGQTSGFGVAEHLRAIRRYTGFSPDFALVNAQRIDPEVFRLYAAAHQSPVALDPAEYEETALLPGDPSARPRVLVEGSMVIEADLASSVVQYSASLDHPGESRAVRVLRHDSEKLTAVLLELLRRT